MGGACVLHPPRALDSLRELTSATHMDVAMLNNVVAHGRLCESGILKFCKAKFPVHVRTMLHENVYLDSLL